MTYFVFLAAFSYSLVCGSFKAWTYYDYMIVLFVISFLCEEIHQVPF